jgi:acetylornithine deacetylase/succinyl-diaminopimelate desuccinylase-like protein
VFSAERAMTHVRTIANEPHPAGSRAMAKVARYLAAELERLGLDVRPLVARDPNIGITLRIVAARLKGRDPSGAVMLVAHPDSVPYGPGAGRQRDGRREALIEVLTVLERTLTELVMPATSFRRPFKSHTGEPGPISSGGNM